MEAGHVAGISLGETRRSARQTVRRTANDEAASRSTANGQQPSHVLHVVYRPLRELVPYAKNARVHSARQIDKLRASLARFGWTNPLLIADGVMIAGHARLQAAIAMAEAGQPIAHHADPWTGPTLDLARMSAAERRAYRITDNLLAEDSTWDVDLVKFELDELRMGGFDLAEIGFDPAKLEKMLAPPIVEEPQLNAGFTYQVLVECSGEVHQAALIEELRQKGLSCKPLIL